MSQGWPSEADQVSRLIYRSRSLIPESEYKSELGKLFTAARSFNKKRGITGALLFADGWFVQTLEGDGAAIETLYEHIINDSRHDTVTLVETQASVERVFSRWSMARVGDDAESDLPMIANKKSGIAQAASRPTTPAQDALLDHMREILHGDAQIG